MDIIQKKQCVSGYNIEKKMRRDIIQKKSFVQRYHLEKKNNLRMVTIYKTEFAYGYHIENNNERGISYRNNDVLRDTIQKKR